jgi:hypothetical protein
MCSGRVSSSCSTRDTCIVTVKRNEHTHYYNRYTILMHVGDVRLIWMHVDIKIFLPLFGQFSEIIVCIFICLCSLITTRIWGTRTACFKDNNILWQNVCPDLYIQHEQNMSPFQRRERYCYSRIYSSSHDSSSYAHNNSVHNLDEMT